jgi:hypothetical protein
MLLRKVSSGLLRRVALVSTVVSEEPGPSRLEGAAGCGVTAVLTSAPRHNNPEDTIIQYELCLRSRQQPRALCHLSLCLPNRASNNHLCSIDGAEVDRLSFYTSLL